MAAKRIEGFRLIDAGWDTELDRALQHDRSTVKIVSPFIKRRASERLFAQGQPTSLKVITRFNLADFAGGVSDIGALRRMLEAGARLRGVRNLHAKLYLFGTSRVIVTSANLTEAALLRNHEFGFVATDTAIIKRCQKYFDDLWARAGQNLTAELLDNWEEQLSRHLATGGRPDKASGLGDEGANLGLGSTKRPSPRQPPSRTSKHSWLHPRRRSGIRMRRSRSPAGTSRWFSERSAGPAWVSGYCH